MHVTSGQHGRMENDIEKEDVDFFRDTPIRYLGYSNEVGEAFRAQVPVRWVHLSYVAASGYVVADAVHKGWEASQKSWEDESKRRSRVGWAVLDTLIWQGLASVAIPGFTINRICKFSGILLKKSTSWPGPTRKWTTTAVGLLSIPFIIKPIDKSVDYLMENTLRKWYHMGPVLEDLVHHNRNE
ncbi:mitochondrial fission process protein 1-like [Ostrea edulis]|uniref:mitochondrial fission process protein 1-like n=1 Tax=Ostrea edulis TaxID=37623 RepID=UPI0024AEAF4E|nr:mitochondrial fission process protein 1-like [Ostrea edulis]